MYIKCPNCGQTYNVDEKLSGQAVQCSNCGTGFSVSSVDAPLSESPITLQATYDATNNATYTPKPNAEFMRLARESLRGKWGVCILAFFLYFVIIFVVNSIPIVNFIGSFLIGAFTLGFAGMWLGVVRKGKTTVSQIFDGFNNFWTAFCVYFLVTLFTILWMLLLIIPGIIASYSYAMAFYIVVDNPGISASEAIQRSKAMMKGRKWKLFCLFCRFIGWGLLCILTFGIGFLWLMPYVGTSMAHFYEDAKLGCKV